MAFSEPSKGDQMVNTQETICGLKQKSWDPVAWTNGTLCGNRVIRSTWALDLRVTSNHLPKNGEAAGHGFGRRASQAAHVCFCVFLIYIVCFLFFLLVVLCFVSFFLGTRAGLVHQWTSFWKTIGKDHWIDSCWTKCLESGVPMEFKAQVSLALNAGNGNGKCLEKRMRQVAHLL